MGGWAHHQVFIFFILLLFCCNQHRFWFFLGVILVFLCESSVSSICSTSKIYASHKAFEIIPIRKGVTDPNDQNYSPRIRKKTCCITCSLRVRDTDVLSTRWLEYKRHWRPLQRARKVRRATPFASPDDGVTVNGVPQTSSSSELEQMRVKLDRALQNEDLSSGLIQSIHDAARAIELAILEHSSSLKDTWFRKTWLGVDKNAWVKTLSYQVSK